MRALLVTLILFCTALCFAQQTEPPAPQQSAPVPSQTPPAPAPETPAPAEPAPPAETAEPPAPHPQKNQKPLQEAWEILRNGAQSKSTDRRTKAIGVLGLVPNNLEARRYAEAALQDSEASVRIAAATALGDMHSRASIPLLKQRLVDDSTGVVLACAKSLLSMKDNSGYEVYYAILTGQRKAKGSLIDDQLKILHDPKKLAQIGFEEGLGFVPFAGMGYTAYKMLSKDEVSPVRAAAARALATDPDPESAKALVAALKDKSWIVRKAALDAIAKRSDHRLLSPVIPVMEDDKDIVMYTAAAAVVHLAHGSLSHVRHRKS